MENKCCSHCLSAGRQILQNAKSTNNKSNGLLSFLSSFSFARPDEHLFGQGYFRRLYRRNAYRVDTKTLGTRMTQIERILKDYWSVEYY
jgi:hypothetical protein